MNEEQELEVTIDVWKADMLSSIDKFVAHYKVQRECDPDNFPEKAYLGEWDDWFAVSVDHSNA